MYREDHELAREALRRAPWLKNYPKELAESLVKQGRFSHLGIGEWAQAEGDARNGLFVVADGLLHSYCAAPGGREVLIGFAGSGSVLGHATRFSGGPRLVTAVCVVPSILLEVSEAALERIAEHMPEIWRAMADCAYAHMQSALRMATELIALRPRERIAARLLAMVGDGPFDAPPLVLANQELLGEMVGVSRKTMNMHLSQFEQTGLVQLGYGQIVLSDVAGLRAVAHR